VLSDLGMTRSEASRVEALARVVGFWQVQVPSS
jgi:hypothetical protein